MEELTLEQRTVTERPLATQTFVIAGPGTGKTHTLAARLRTLFDSGEITEPDDVAVLSFTRAAVAELGRRLGGRGLSSAVAATTIDALARDILRSAGAQVDGGYEAVVITATRVLADAPEVAVFQHVIVDEAQDLVTPRLEFVEQLLARASGFTVLGDPAQGIYGHGDSGPDTDDAIGYLSKQYPTALRLGLTEDHRSRTQHADIASHLRVEAFDGRIDRLEERLSGVLRNQPHVSVEALGLVLRNAGGRTAVLCRTNGDVLLISRSLTDARVLHRIQQAADVVAPPRWIADLLGQVEAETVALEDLPETPMWSAVQRAAAFEALVVHTGTAGGTVSLDRVRARLGTLGLSVVAGEEDAPPILSTVHRSKGLEFDRVFVLEFPPPHEDADAREANVYFVALTRAREETLMIERPKPAAAIRKRADRWVETPWRRDTLTAIEVRVGDVDRRAPLLDDGSAAFAQRHIATRLKLGDAVSLERRQAYGHVDYAVVHKGLEVARMSDHFTNALQRSGANPNQISGLMIDRVSTAASATEVTEAAGIGSSGLWLVPEVFGFGRLR